MNLLQPKLFISLANWCRCILSTTKSGIVCIVHQFYSFISCLTFSRLFSWLQSKCNSISCNCNNLQTNNIHTLHNRQQMLVIKRLQIIKHREVDQQLDSNRVFQQTKQVDLQQLQVIISRQQQVILAHLLMRIIEIRNLNLLSIYSYCSITRWSWTEWYRVLVTSLD